MSKRRTATRGKSQIRNPKSQIHPEPQILKLHLGCGHKMLDGYVNIDLYSPAADLKLDITDLGKFGDSTVDEIYLNAVFEHLYIFEQRRALAEWRRVLKPGGQLIISSIPDFDEIVRAYINRAPGNDGGTFDIEEVSRYTHGAYGPHDKLGQIHKDVFTRAKMRRLLERAGFEVSAIESVRWQDEPNPVNMNVAAVKAAETGAEGVILSAAKNDEDARNDEDDTLYSPLPAGSEGAFAAVYCVYDDIAWLAESVESVYDACSAIHILVSDRPWRGEAVDTTPTVEAVSALPDPENKVRLVRGHWSSEAQQRNAGLGILRGEGTAYCFVIDADEVYDPTDLKRMMRFATQHPEVDCWHAEMDTYWKSWRYKIDPREPLKPAIFLKVGDPPSAPLAKGEKGGCVRFTQNRNVEECAHGLIPPEIGICHHLSYARADEQLLRKISTFSHAHEVRPGWFEEVWSRWDEDHSLRDLHPTHPSAYQRAVPQPHWALPPAIANHKSQITDHKSETPTTSIVVLTRNQLDYTRRCLESIDRCTPLLPPFARGDEGGYEVVVVDNGSTDGTVDYLKEWASGSRDRRAILNESNLGFAEGNNVGIAAAQGDYVVLMNNDVVVTPGWLHRMLACAARDPRIGIVGPVTNAISGPQLVDQPLYETQSLAGLDEFALEWAAKHERQTTRVFRAVGFCMLIRRSLIDMIGGLDTRYGLGNFEDDDFCVRAALAGFKCLIARDAYVHHHGSATFAAENVDYRSLMAKNWEVFKHKWGLPADLRLGMGYNVSEALKRGFDPAQHYVDYASGREPAPKHSTLLTLCLIARNEEEFLPGCIDSGREIADEVVLLDTGSNDRTVEIARSYGAKVHHFEWTEDYSEARNEAIKHASGEWILFLDADERLDAASRRTVRDAVENPAADAYELVFHNYCRTGSEHPEIVHRACRLHRNRPEYRYEGRIHENVVPSIAAAGGKIAELDAVVHHYGYQPEVKKQRNKHERYLKLLHAELDDKPGDIYVLYHLTAAYCAEAEFEKAIPYLDELAASVPPEHAFAAQACSRLANAYWATGRHEDALAAAAGAADKGITHPEITFTKGNALLALERYAEAIEAFEEAIQTGASSSWLGDPGTHGYKANFGIARAWIGLEDYGKAAEFCERVVADRPDHAAAHEVLALAYAHLGRHNESESHWHEVTRVVGESAALHHRIAGFFEEHGEPARAEMRYLRALELNPEQVETLNDLGRLYSGQGKAQQALDMFARAVEADPDYANAYFNAGDILYTAGRYLEAAEVYENGLTRDSRHAPAFFALGNCCFHLGLFDAAATAYRQALDIDPGYSDARGNLALAEEAAGEKAA